MWSELSKQEVEVIEMKNSLFTLVLCEIISFNFLMLVLRTV